MNLSEIQSLNNEELGALAKEMGVIENGAVPRRQELMNKVLHSIADENGNLKASGILSIVSDGYGFLRQSGGQPGSGDVYVSQSQIRRFSLRIGDEISGQVRPPKDGERYFGLVRVEGVNGLDPEASRNRPHFETLTAVFPTQHIILETAVFVSNRVDEQGSSLYC